jgi:tRNA(Ile)-lysidine synthetase-like protein
VPAEASQIDVEIPPGRWAVGVSGGADSVALLLLAQPYPDVTLHIVHLDHQTRGQASTDDADFVASLGKQLAISYTIARRDEIEPSLTVLPHNLSARYRAVRLALFRQVIQRENLQGVLLAHHADDQAETILLRLLRGSGPAGLGGMKARREIDGITLLRPLLSIQRKELREFLTMRNQPWREDASNQSSKYARNRVRRFLELRPELHDPLIAVGRACAEYSLWIKQNAPMLGQKFPAITLAELPRMLACESVRHWLVEKGVPPGELNPDVLDRLRQMATDAATPARQLFPKNVTVHRRRGWIATL